MKLFNLLLPPKGALLCLLGVFLFVTPIGCSTCNGDEESQKESENTELTADAGIKAPDAINNSTKKTRSGPAHVEKTKKSKPEAVKKTKKNGGAKTTDPKKSKRADTRTNNKKQKTDKKAPPPKENPKNAKKQQPIKTTKTIQNEKKTDSLNISNLLTVGDIRSTASYRGQLQPQPLLGSEATDTYKGVRFVPKRKKDGYGFGIQVWRPKKLNDVNARFRQLQKHHLSTTTFKNLGDGAFNSEFQGIITLCFKNRNKRSVVALTCDSKICDLSKLSMLARKIIPKL